MDLTKRERIGLGIFALILLLIISTLYFYRNKNNTVEVFSKNGAEVTQSSNEVKDKNNNLIKVYISGEINKPGVYQLMEGDRVEKLIDLAGGFTKNADNAALNLAMKLKDEDYIRVSGKLQEVAQLSNGNVSIGSSTGVGTGLININTASLEELKELPRIGDAIGQRIIDYREKIGPFRDIKNLMDVSGIGTKMFENIKDKITTH